MGKLALVVAIVCLSGGTTQAQSCNKVVSFAVADVSGVHPFMGTGNWIGKWVEKNAKKHPDICFSQSPMQGRANYLIVLSQSAGYLTGFDPVVRTNTTTATAPVSGSGTVTSNYGGTWNYTYNGTSTTTTTTTTNENVPYSIRSNTVYAYAYGEGGAIVSQRYHVYSTKSGGDTTNTAGYNIGNALAAINARGRLLNAAVNDIEKQVPSATPIVQSARAVAAEIPAPAQKSLVSTPAPSSPCKTYINTGEKEFITENADGKILILSDGSIWEVTEVDTIDSSLWLVTDDVIVIRAENAMACFNFTIINTNEHGEKVQAEYLGQR